MGRFGLFFFLVIVAVAGSAIGEDRPADLVPVLQPILAKYPKIPGLAAAIVENDGVLTHAGSNGMWYCVAWVAPERGFAVLSAVNIGGDDAAQACDDAAGAMIGWREKRDAAR